jgi:hypothetical protein
MKCIRTELKTSCTVIIAYDHITILDSRKNVLYSLHRTVAHAFVWRERLKAYSGCVVRIEYHNHILEKIVAITDEEKVIADLEF